MKTLLPLVFVELVLATQHCSNICKFIHYTATQDTSSINKTSFSIPTTPGSVTGIITADFDFFGPKFAAPNIKWDFLRFVNEADQSYQSLVFKLYKRENAANNLELFGRHNGTNYGKLITNINPPINIQISDINMISDQCYTIYLGVPGSAAEKNYGYMSDSDWNKFSAVRLNTTIEIRNDGRCTVYNFISTCRHPTPQLCDINGTETVTAVYGTSYALECSASGAPYLTANWARDTFKQTYEIASEVYDNTTADNYIISTINITSFTVDHIGTWTCTISNKNFGNSVTKLYNLTYSANVAVVRSPSSDWYVANKGDVSFVWEVQGWPIDLVSLDCGDTGFNIDYDTNTWYSETTPKVRTTLNLSNGTLVDQINCALYNDGSILDTINITRVGYNCTEGERGIGKLCEVCPKGETSVDGTGECYNASNSCNEGQYGVGTDCIDCPTGEVSPVQTVKIQDCQAVSGNCSSGEFGYNGSCSNCPVGSVSTENSVKVQECDSVSSLCGAGTYGYGNMTCTNCPVGMVSPNRTVKSQDCYNVSSNCMAGDYGVNSSCNPCPISEISHAEAVKIQECRKANSTCDAGTYGYGNATCNNCPVGMVSPNKTVKIQECYNETNSCYAGQYGIKTHCTDCPKGTISPVQTVKTQDCQTASGNCSSGEFGYNGTCSNCPVGSVSTANAVKIQECDSVSSLCSAGTYGYGNLTCKNCPIGMVSPDKTVKIQECYNETNSCDAGQYGVKTDCTDCPKGTISPVQTVKTQDCQAVSGDCASGEFGYNGRCSNCPAGNVSTEDAVKIQECYLVNSACSAGTYGYGNMTCENCPIGKVSLNKTVKIQECFDVSSNCVAGDYGVNSSCNPCPTSEISDAEAVKVQECRKVDSTCDAGTYGHEDSACENCPVGMISPESAVKLQECHAANSTCDIGDWGVDNDCSKCPQDETSHKNTVKIQECYLMGSFCDVGEFGFGYDCSPCPKDTTSHAKARYESECFANPSSLNIGVIAGSSSGVVVLVVVSVLIAVFLVRRSRTKPDKDKNIVISNSVPLNDIDDNTYSNLEDTSCNRSSVNTTIANQNTAKIEDESTYSKLGDHPRARGCSKTYARLNRDKFKKTIRQPNSTLPTQNTHTVNSDKIQIDQDSTYSTLGDHPQNRNDSPTYATLNRNKFKKPRAPENAPSAQTNDNSCTDIYSTVSKPSHTDEPIDEEPLYADQFSVPLAAEEQDTYASVEFVNEVRQRKDQEDAEEDTYASVELVNRDKVRMRRGTDSEVQGMEGQECVYNTVNEDNRNSIYSTMQL